MDTKMQSETDIEAQASQTANMVESDIPPKETIYINNLNEKIKKAQLKKSLYAVFSQFGSVVDIVCSKTLQLKGQAWVVFDTTTAATNALRQMQGFPFYDKSMRIQFAKEKSDAIAKREGSYVFVPRAKRKAEEELRQKAAGAALPPSKKQAGASVMIPAPPPARAAPPNKVLFAENLPSEVGSDMLNMLFSQYSGFQEVRLVPGRGVAFIEFESEAQATPALQGLHNFKLTPTHNLKLSYRKQ